MWPAIAAAVGSAVVGGLFSQDGQEDANHANAQEAELNRQYQERMSSTAHQREVADLKAAGLNPMLSARLGGSSTPQGSMAVYKNEKEDLGRNIASIGSSAAQMASVENIRAQTEKAKAESDLASAQAEEARRRTPVHDSTIAVNQATVDRIQSEIPKIQADADLSRAQMSKIIQEIPNIIQSRGLISAQTERELAQAGLSRAQIAEVVPRIRQMLAQAGLDDAKAINEAVVRPFLGMKSDWSDVVNLPKKFSSAFSASEIGTSLGEWFSDHKVDRDFFDLNKDQIRRFKK